MAKAKKLPSGNWRVRVYVGTDENGKMIYKSFTASTKKEAEFLAAEYNLTRKEKPKGVTVGDAINGYIDSKRNVLSPTTIETYEKIRRNDLQSLMNVPLAKLDAIAVQRAVNQDAKRLSSKSVRSAHGLLSAALAMYLPDFVLRTTLPAKEHKIKDLPTPQEVIEAVRGTEVELPVLLAMWLTLRLGELQGIRYCDIAPDGTLTLQKEKTVVNGHYIEKDSLKTYTSTRRLIIPSELMAMIPPPETDDPEEYVFKFAAGGIYKRFKKAIQEAGLKDMTFHDLRHMSASIMVALGIPDRYAQERGGWISDNTLKAVYQHTFSDVRLAVEDKLNSYFRQIYDTKYDTTDKK